MTPTDPKPAPLSMAADWLVQAALGGEDEAQPSRWLATLLGRDRAMTGAAAAELALDLGELGLRLALWVDDDPPLGRSGTLYRGIALSARSASA